MASNRVTKAQQYLLITANQEGAIKPKGAQIRAARTLMDDFGYLEQNEKQYVKGIYTITDAGIAYLREHGLLATPPAAATPAEAAIPASADEQIPVGTKVRALKDRKVMGVGTVKAGTIGTVVPRR